MAPKWYELVLFRNSARKSMMALVAGAGFEPATFGL